MHGPRHSCAILTLEKVFGLVFDPALVIECLKIANRPVCLDCLPAPRNRNDLSIC